MADGSSTKKPSHRVFMVDNYDKAGEQKSFWTDIGAGWTNKDGSLSIELKAFPLNGSRIVVQVAKEQVAKEKDGEHARA